MIRGSKQLAALRAAARQEIFDVLERMGTVSVAELAAAVGRPADALYFHLRALSRAGLVRTAGLRSRGGRSEALYCTTAPELMLQYEPENKANRDAVSAIVASMLRLTMRDFRDSFRPGNVCVAGAGRELWAARKVGRLASQQLGAVNTGIAALLERLAAKSTQKGRLYAVTVVLTPIDHRGTGRKGDEQKQTSKRRKIS
jgi:DNA-binding transcriptional ArsR family regulator